MPHELYPRMEQGGVILSAAAIATPRGVPRLLLGAPAREVLKRYGSPAGRLTWTGPRSGSASGWRQPPWPILLVVGMPIAYWVTFSRWRWKFLVEAVVALPLVLPPTVLGFYILVGLGPRPFRPR